MDETTMMTTTKMITVTMPRTSKTSKTLLISFELSNWSLLIWLTINPLSPSNVDSPIGLSNHLVFSTFRSVSPIIWPTTELLIILRSVPLFYWPTTNKIPGRRNLSTTLGRQLQPVNTEEIPTMTHINMDLTRSMVRSTVNRDGLMGLTAMFSAMIGRLVTALQLISIIISMFC
ncbi:hypothetical protein MJO29_009433 [Puccinia striiformis f. sp. tritici]|nr:hypothetical protein MJO29_009433 [Puccinia striiformis f. sp. tritici]